MLIATLSLAAAQPVAEPPVDNEITVIANKLRAWRGKWRMRDGAVTCKTTRSTGDRAIDDLGCAAMVTCITPLASQWQEVERADLSRKEMNARLNKLLESANVTDCFRTTHQSSIAALAAARRSKRS